MVFLALMVYLFRMPWLENSASTLDLVCTCFFFPMSGNKLLPTDVQFFEVDLRSVTEGYTHSYGVGQIN